MWPIFVGWSSARGGGCLHRKHVSVSFLSPGLVSLRIVVRCGYSPRTASDNLILIAMIPGHTSQIRLQSAYGTVLLYFDNAHNVIDSMRLFGVEFRILTGGRAFWFIHKWPAELATCILKLHFLAFWSVVVKHGQLVPTSFPIFRSKLKAHLFCSTYAF